MSNACRQEANARKLFVSQCLARPERRVPHAERREDDLAPDPLLIEILEHLEDPDTLLADTAKALRPGGQLYLTTATNIPQFDHLYNYPEDHTGFERQLSNLGLKIDAVEILAHRYMDIEIGAKNHVYALTKV